MEDPIKLDHNEIYKAYKADKLSISFRFLQGILKFAIGVMGVQEVVIAYNNEVYSLENKGLLSRDNFTHSLLLVISILMLAFVKNQKFSYSVWLIVMILLDFRLVFVVFWKFPDFSCIVIAVSVHFLCHARLEFIYNYALGIVMICIHTAIWVFGAFYSGFIKTTVPPNILLGFCVYVVLQFVWYNYQVSKDYERTERKLQIEMKQENIQGLLNVIPEGIAVMDENFRIIMKNNAFGSLLSNIEMLQIKFVEKFHETPRLFNDNLSTQLEDFKESDKLNITFGVFLNQNRLLECTGSKMQWNKHPALVLTFREVSKLQDKINFTSKVLKILQGVSHELKTPLNHVINEHQEILNQDSLNLSQIRSHLEKSFSASIYLLSIIRDMTDYSHMKFNNLGLSFSWVKIDDVLTDCIKILQNMHSQCKIVFEKNIENTFSYTDHNKLKQCVLSILLSALG